MKENNDDLAKEFRLLKEAHEKMYSLHLKTITVIITVAAVIIGITSIKSTSDIDEARKRIDDKLEKYQMSINDLAKIVYQTNNELTKDAYDKLRLVNKDLETSFSNLKDHTEKNLEKNIGEFERKVNELTHEGIRSPNIEINYNKDSLNGKVINLSGLKIYRPNKKFYEILKKDGFPDSLIAKIKKNNPIDKEFIGEEILKKSFVQSIGEADYSKYCVSIKNSSYSQLVSFTSGNLHLKNNGNQIATNISARLYLDRDLSLIDWEKVEQEKKDFKTTYWFGFGTSLNINPNEDWVFHNFNGRINPSEGTKVKCLLEVYYGQKEPSKAEFILFIGIKD